MFRNNSTTVKMVICVIVSQSVTVCKGCKAISNLRGIIYSTL